VLPFGEFAGQIPQIWPFLKVFGREKFGLYLVFGRQKFWHLLIVTIKFG
jgi:hypothetical protein